MLSQITFQTQGDWSTSTVTHMGKQIDCMAIKLNLKSNSFLEKDIGGTHKGVHIQDALILVPAYADSIDAINVFIEQGRIKESYNYCNEMSIFPGEISIFNATGQELKVVFNDPDLSTNNILVFLEGIEVTQDFCEILCEINYIENIVTCYLTITTDKHFLSHSNEQMKIL